MEKPPVNGEESWSIVIRPRSKFFSFNVKELVHYRDLVVLFVKRDFQTVYRQTVLGPLWFVIQPIMTTIIYTFIFGSLAKLSTDGVPQTLFYFGGTMLWTYFQVTMLNVSDTFVQNAGLFSKVYFPRLAVPASKVISNLVSLGIQTLTLAAFYLYYALSGATVRPGWGIMTLPLIVAWLAALACGFGMIISALTTKYRDLRQLLTFGMQLWMYATPVVYPLSQIPEKWRWVMRVNPVSAPIESFRHVAFGAPAPDAGLSTISLTVTALLFFLGLLLFHRNEATFVDVA